MKRISNWAAYISVATSFGAACLFTYWLLWPYNVLSGFVEDADIRLGSTTVSQGEVLELKGLPCNPWNRVGTVDRAFVDGTVYWVPTQATRVVPCDGRRRSILVSVPNHLPAGTYRLFTTLTFKVNPVRDVIYRHKTELFTVITRKD